MSVFKIIMLVLVLLLAILFLILFRNGAKLFDEPGVTERLGIFLTVNTAETSDKHKFAELRTPVFDEDAEKLYLRIINTGTELGWGTVSHDSEKYDITFIVNSPVFLFKDDVYIRVQSISENQSSLYIRSSSRKGRADFAANSGHIQKLIRELRNVD